MDSRTLPVSSVPMVLKGRGHFAPKLLNNASVHLSNLDNVVLASDAVHNGADLCARNWERTCFSISLTVELHNLFPSSVDGSRRRTARNVLVSTESGRDGVMGTLWWVSSWWFSCFSSPCWNRQRTLISIIRRWHAWQLVWPCSWAAFFSFRLKGVAPVLPDLSVLLPKRGSLDAGRTPSRTCGSSGVDHWPVLQPQLV